MLRRLFPLLALAVAAGCRSPTEIVVFLDVTGGAPPPSITVRLGRTSGFINDPAPGTFPSFVEPSLDSTNNALDLIVTPQGAHTDLSLLPPVNGPTDLTVAVTVDAPGYLVSPTMTQKLAFVDHKSQELHFTIMAPVPDGGARPDLVHHDAAPPNG
jgi:hypothetical protein